MHYFLQQLHYLDKKSISDKKNRFEQNNIVDFVNKNLMLP